MCTDVLAPEIGLIKSDEFYLFYEMMMQSLKNDNVKDGVNKSLFLLRQYLKSGNIGLFKKNDAGNYIFKLSDSNMSELIQPVGCIINKTNPLVENKGFFDLELKLGRLDNMMLMHIGISNNVECILAILNVDRGIELEPQFWERAKETVQIILKRASSYERNTKAITTDLLTNLDNRNSYEMRMHQINEDDENLVLGVFDLFRLKYINDNFSHVKGDQYIKESAKILNKYWPKQKVQVNDDSTESYLDTGHCVYRYGGDEFVLLTTVETEQLANIKGELAKDEVKLLNLNIGDNIPIGINYGIVRHTPGHSIKETFTKADEIMQDHKSQMYKKYNINNRRR